MPPITLSYIIPILDEEPIIETTLGQFIEDFEAMKDVVGDYEILVVDDGSRDRTAEIVGNFASRHPKVRLIRHERNLGVGRAIRTGLESARMDWFSVNCADQPFRAADIRKMAALFEKNDVVVVCREDRSANTPYRKLTSLGNYFLVRLIFWSALHDFQFAQFYRMQFLSRAKLISEGSLLPPEMIFRCQRMGARVAETPRLPFHRRGGGKSKFGHPKHIVITLWEMARLRLDFWKENWLSRGNTQRQTTPPPLDEIRRFD